MPQNTYSEYFEIDEDYFPQFNDSSIAAAAPDQWTKTYPHATFIDMLKSAERMLARQEKRSLWIEGAYGTGKSVCAYTLKRIFEVPEQELRGYWQEYEPLSKNGDLLEKLIGHKSKGIVTAYRYASGMISTPRDLFISIQESVKLALEKAGYYGGESTLKDCVIKWLEAPEQKAFFDSLLKKPEWAALFSQPTADSVLDALRKGGEVKSLMDNIFRLADKEGIRALSIDSDQLINWLKDVIEKNNISIVLIWDEFSDYFRNNRESLSEFQKIVELVNLVPFYFIVVTHESGQLYANADATWTKVRDRFMQLNISLPDNIAFNLIAHALSVKKVARSEWDMVAGDLNARLKDSTPKVMAVAKISNPQDIRGIMPIHPMAAILLKNIASAFKSNQRSMFDFIKSSQNEDTQAFQWFIQNTGPYDNHPLLTIDMLWNFFYEKGRDNLTPDIRLILDVFPQQKNLREDESRVLKAILMMQAIDQRLGGSIDLFKTTEKNLSYVFEGISDLEGTKSSTLAKGLKAKGILISQPIGNGDEVFAAAVLAGDQAKIDTFKNEARQNSNTAKLVTEGELGTVLSLSPALRLRFADDSINGGLTPVTISDFNKTINRLRDFTPTWNFHAVIALAKDEDEAANFRRTIRSTVMNSDYKDIVFIDALSTPLGKEQFEQYVDRVGLSMYYQGNNNTTAREYADKAKRILNNDWKTRVYNGSFVIYNFDNQAGEKVANGQGVHSILQTIVNRKFPDILDFRQGLSESQLKITNMRSSAKSGIIQSTSGVVVGIERIIPQAWKVDRYWENASAKNDSIIRMKSSVDELIAQKFKESGQVSIEEVYDMLEGKFGFAPSNLSGFLTGFLLKEYSQEPYRYSDAIGGQEMMSPDKLAEMIGNYVGKKPKPKPTNIVKMTKEEKAFIELTETAWNLPSGTLTSASQAAREVAQKMRGFNLPVWCLEEIDSTEVYDVAEMYMQLISKEGSEAHRIAMEIGRRTIYNPNLSGRLKSLLTSENCLKGMEQFLRSFEDGKVSKLAQEVGAEVLADVRGLFQVKHSSLWDKETGISEIKKLLTDYGIIKETNTLLSGSSRNLSMAMKLWRDQLRQLKISKDAIVSKQPSQGKLFDFLGKIFKEDDLFPEQRQLFLTELTNDENFLINLFQNTNNIFAEVYAPYIEGLTSSEISKLKANLSPDLFLQSKSEANVKVKDAAEEMRRKQLRSQLLELWQSRTKTKNPKEWSSRYLTPILLCVPEEEYKAAQKAFGVLNNGYGLDIETREAIEYLQRTQMFDALQDEKVRDSAFVKGVIGDYKIILPDLSYVRMKLDTLLVEPYDWNNNPMVKSKVKELAEAEYMAGGSDRVISLIDSMNDSELKQYLKQLVSDNLKVGIEILSSRSGH